VSLSLGLFVYTRLNAKRKTHEWPHDSSSQLDRRGAKEGERSTERREAERIRARRRYINPSPYESRWQA